MPCRPKLKACAGPGASWQPPGLADHLHETVATWVRTYFIAHPIVKGPDLATNWQNFEEGMLECEAHINTHHDLAGLCVLAAARTDAARQCVGGRLHY